MKKIISFILGSIFALNLTITAANSAANVVRVAYFLEWPSPNLEDMQKKNFAKALGVPVKWTNFTNGGAMTDAMLAGDIDISYSQGLVPFINAVKSKAPIKLVDIAMEYGMGGTTCVTSNASGITKANATELEGKKVAVPLGTMAEYVFDESMKVVGADRGKMDIIQMDPEEGADEMLTTSKKGYAHHVAMEPLLRCGNTDGRRKPTVLRLDFSNCFSMINLANNHLLTDMWWDCVRYYRCCR